jgi:hypothetical protein
MTEKQAQRVMAALGAATHAFPLGRAKAWVAGPDPRNKSEDGHDAEKWSPHLSVRSE